MYPNKKTTQYSKGINHLFLTMLENLRQEIETLPIGLIENLPDEVWRSLSDLKAVATPEQWQEFQQDLLRLVLDHRYQLIQAKIAEKIDKNWLDTLETEDDILAAAVELTKSWITLCDEEDRHVLETAIAGKANYLITANWKDFLVKETQRIIPERHYRYISPSHTIEIVHPYLMMEWIRQDKLLI